MAPNPNNVPAKITDLKNSCPETALYVNTTIMIIKIMGTTNIFIAIEISIKELASKIIKVPTVTAKLRYNPAAKIIESKIPLLFGAKIRAGKQIRIQDAMIYAPRSCRGAGPVKFNLPFITKMYKYKPRKIKIPLRIPRIRFLGLTSNLKVFSFNSISLLIYS